MTRRMPDPPGLDVAQLEAYLRREHPDVVGDGTLSARVIAGGRSNLTYRVDDQAGRPTWHRDLAAALAQLAREDMTGVLHVAGDGEPGSWADLARATLRAVGVTARVRNVDTATYLQRDGSRVATRPANGVLSLEQARREGVRLGDWRTSLIEYVGELS